MRNCSCFADGVCGAGRVPGVALRASPRQPSSRPACRAEAPKGAKAGGARRDRTDDLLLAKQALSQLSYGPQARGRLVECQRRLRSNGLPSRSSHSERRLVGLGRLELPTSRLSSARSNQLSYRPAWVARAIHVNSRCSQLKPQPIDGRCWRTPVLERR